MKGFIGPIGDDLPSLIAVMLALTLFFSGLTFSINAFDQKRERARLMKGALDISRSIIKNQTLPNSPDKLTDIPEAQSVAKSNDLAFNAGYGKKGSTTWGDSYPSGTGGCDETSIHFSYLVIRENKGLETLRVCVWEAGT